VKGVGEVAMGDTGDRMDRAGRYVLGLMDDEERDRAERDLEIDPAFRDAMVEIAERMHVFDRLPAPDQSAGKPPQDYWRLIKEKITAMPQMRAAAEPAEPEPQVTFGRRRSDKLRGTISPEIPPRTVGTGLHAVAGNRSLVLALCLIAAFALGYVAGITSVDSPPPAATTAAP
jgi:anti-sigma-K factor RskA